MNSEKAFWSDRYLKINQRRLEHLASLRLPLTIKTVLEVGAGIGDHTDFFVDRGCLVTTTEAKSENLKILRERFKNNTNVEVEFLDMNYPEWKIKLKPFDIVYCYGLLYHLHEPLNALRFMAENCSEMLLLETCVSLNDNESIEFCNDSSSDPTGSMNGTGCRPSRSWVFNKLKELFDYVYLPTTQPFHKEFPLDWRSLHTDLLTRAIFIAAKKPFYNTNFIDFIPSVQTR